jgi:ribosomal 50S subunit-recycling heat shock protein
MKTNRFIFWVVLSLVACLALQLPTDVSAQGVELGDSVVITAEVVAIDRVDRTLALLGPDGRVVVVEVDHTARNFDQITVGDMLKVEYYESIALYIGKKGQKPDATAGLVAARSAKGDKPAGVVVEAVDVSAKILAIDKKKRAVTLELPDGKKVTTNVDKSVKAFDSLKKGDSIHVRYTEALAISVERP